MKFSLAILSLLFLLPACTAHDPFKHGSPCTKEGASAKDAEGYTLICKEDGR